MGPPWETEGEGQESGCPQEQVQCAQGGAEDEDAGAGVHFVLPRRCPR